MRKLFTFRVLCFSAVIASALTACDREDLPTPTVFEGAKPVVDFAFEATDPTDPFAITFKNRSKNFKELEWIFGDDSVSYKTDSVLPHLYTRNGAFKVYLTATGEDGTKATMERELRIQPPVTLTVAKQGDAYKFSYTTTLTKSAISWNFGELADPAKPELGQAKSTAESPVYKYRNTGSETVSLSITTDKGSVATYTYLLRESIPYKDITTQYLRNTMRPFVATKRSFSRDVGRWGILDNWTINGAVKNHADGMGGFDRDHEGGNNMSMEAWGGDPKIINGKIFQSPTLPAGKYIFAVTQPAQEMRGAQNEDFAFVVAAAGEDIPNIEDRQSALASTRLLHPNDVPNKTVMLPFTATQAGQISLGILATLNRTDQFIRVQEVKLYQAQ